MRQKFRDLLVKAEDCLDEDWHRSQIYGEQVDTCNSIWHLLLAVHKQDCDGFKAGSLKTGFRALTRSLKLDVPEAQADFNNDPILGTIEDVVSSKMQELQAAGNGDRDQARVLSDDEVLAIIESFDPDTPGGLLRLVVFYLSLFCALRGCQHVTIKRQFLTRHIIDKLIDSIDMPLVSKPLQSLNNVQACSNPLPRIQASRQSSKLSLNATRFLQRQDY
ncbi:hypothetical protein MP228_006001 [Amoeboaphelidium protococcarum]|nr:hypothetical protein MP228_006001 [Amoeboaphelidium protococcarum]